MKHPLLLSAHLTAFTALLMVGGLANAQTGNDDCTTPDLIVGSGTYSYDTTLATDSVIPVTCSVSSTYTNLNLDVWFEWTADFTGTCEFSLCVGGGHDSKIAVWPATPGACPAPGTELACDDDYCGSTMGYASQTTFAVTSGTSYLLGIGCWTVQTGTGTFNLTDISLPCTTPDDTLEDNDDCTTAVPLPLGSTTGLMVYGAGCTTPDNDFYSVTLAAGELLDVTAYFSHTLGDINLYLDDVSVTGCPGVPVADAQSTTNDEHLIYTNTSGGSLDVVLEVRADGASTVAAAYDLDVFASVPTPAGASYDAGTVGNPTIAPDPTTQGWTDVDPSGGVVTVVALSPDGGTGLNAWAIEDTATAVGGRRHYTSLFTAQGMSLAAESGWTLSQRMRVIGGTLNDIFFEYATGATSADDRYLLFFRVSGGDVVADAALSGNTYTCVGAMDGAYHTFAIRKPAGAANTMAEFLYDGVSLGALPRSASNPNAPNGGVNWGAGSSVATGEANWNSVSFESASVATPFCFGDGSDGVICPCGNSAAVGSGEGCTNVSGLGAYITASGAANVAADTLTLTIHQAAPSDFGIFVQNIAIGAPMPFYNGGLCLPIDSHLVRHYAPPAIQPTVTDGTGMGVNAQPMTVGDFLGDTQPGTTIHYQFWGRDNGGPCGSGANFSSGLSVAWN